MKIKSHKHKKEDKTKKEILSLCNKIKEESTKESSAINQLKNVIQTSLTGIEVPFLAESKNKNLDFSLLSEMLCLIKKLFDINYQKEFENSIKQIDKETKDETILAFINLMLFIDNNSYQQIAHGHHKKNYELPIKTILKLKKTLSESKKNNMGYKLFSLRFENNVNQVKKHGFKVLVPDAVDVAKVFLTQKDSTIATENIIFSFLRYLNIYEAKNIKNGIHEMVKGLKLDNNYLKKIIDYSKTYRIVKASHKEKLNICQMAFSAILKKPFIDLAEIKIPKNIKILNIIIFTGSFAGFTVAHYDTINLIKNLNKQNDNNSTQSLIAIAPITRPWDVPQEALGKSPDFIGPITQRVQAIMMGLCLSERENIFITTKAIPHPKRALNSQERITKIKNNLQNFIQNKNQNVKINFIRCMGVDDVNQTLSKGKEGKYPYNLLLIGRYGKLIDLIKSIVEIQKLGNTKTVITPGIKKTSSSKAIKKYLKNKEDSYWPIPSSPIIVNYLSSIELLNNKNLKNNQNKEEILSIKKIYKKLLLNYPILFSKIN